MRRTITITSCLIMLCLAALTFWIYMKYSGQGASPGPQGNSSVDKTNNKPFIPIENPAMPPVVFESPTRVAFWGDGGFSPCYFDQEKKTLYRWKDVALRREQLLQTPYCGVPSGISMVDSKDFTVTSFEAPVKYWQADGGYRPGYLDRTIWTFYAWKGIVLSKQELLDKSQDGRDAILKADFPSQGSPQVIEIDMPTFLKDKPGLWKKT